MQSLSTRGEIRDGKDVKGICKVLIFETHIEHISVIILLKNIILYHLYPQVPLGANGCAYFTFEELCDRPLGAADYSGLFSKSYLSDWIVLR